MTNCPTLLAEGARQLGAPLSSAQVAALLRLLDELARWNRTYNLTSIEDRAEMVTHHLLDSIAVLPHLLGERIADVGTGAGFPGLPLAIAAAQRRFTLIDSNGKKIRFVAHAVRTLQLANVEPVHARVEALRPQPAFDTVVARAFAPLPQLLQAVRGLCGPHTRVLALKGRRAQEELAAMPATWRLAQSLPLAVPGLGAERQLLVLQPA